VSGPLQTYRGKARLLQGLLQAKEEILGEGAFLIRQVSFNIIFLFYNAVFDFRLFGFALD
jgi:hypothetical protein